MHCLLTDPQQIQDKQHFTPLLGLNQFIPWVAEKFKGTYTKYVLYNRKPDITGTMVHSTPKLILLNQYLICHPMNHVYSDIEKFIIKVCWYWSRVFFNFFFLTLLWEICINTFHTDFSMGMKAKNCRKVKNLFNDC